MARNDCTLLVIVGYIFVPFLSISVEGLRRDERDGSPACGVAKQSHKVLAYPLEPILAPWFPLPPYKGEAEGRGSACSCSRLTVCCLWGQLRKEPAGVGLWLS